MGNHVLKPVTFPPDDPSRYPLSVAVQSYETSDLGSALGRSDGNDTSQSCQEIKSGVYSKGHETYMETNRYPTFRVPREVYFGQRIPSGFDCILDNFGFTHIELVGLSRLFLCQRALCFDFRYCDGCPPSPSCFSFDPAMDRLSLHREEDEEVKKYLSHCTRRNSHHSVVTPHVPSVTGKDMSGPTALPFDGFENATTGKKLHVFPPHLYPAGGESGEGGQPLESSSAPPHETDPVTDRCNEGKGIRGDVLKEERDGSAYDEMKWGCPPRWVFVKGYRFASKESEHFLEEMIKKLMCIQSALSLDIHPNVLTHFHLHVSPPKLPCVLRLWMKDTVQSVALTGFALIESEKQWMIFQMICAMAQLHSAGMFHGNVCTCNFVSTTTRHIFLVDIASYCKPYSIRANATMLRVMTTFFESFHDSPGDVVNLRRPCYLSPERFRFSKPRAEQCQATKAEEVDEPEVDFAQVCAADIYSLGCCIAEVYCHGEALMSFPDCFSLAQYLHWFHNLKSPNEKESFPKFVFPSDVHRQDSFGEACTSAAWFLPQWSLSRVRDPRVVHLVSRMCSPEVAERPTALECLEIGRASGLFPWSFFSFLMPLTTLLLHPLLQCESVCSFFLHSTLVERMKQVLGEESPKETLGGAHRWQMNAAYLDPLSFYHNLSCTAQDYPMYWLHRHSGSFVDWTRRYRVEHKSGETSRGVEEKPTKQDLGNDFKPQQPQTSDVVLEEGHTTLGTGDSGGRQRKRAPRQETYRPRTVVRTFDTWGKKSLLKKASREACSTSPSDKREEEIVPQKKAEGSPSSLGIGLNNDSPGGCQGRGQRRSAFYQASCETQANQGHGGRGVTATSSSQDVSVQIRTRRDSNVFIPTPSGSCSLGDSGHNNTSFSKNQSASPAGRQGSALVTASPLRNASLSPRRESFLAHQKYDPLTDKGQHPHHPGLVALVHLSRVMGGATRQSQEIKSKGWMRSALHSVWWFLCRCRWWGVKKQLEQMDMSDDACVLDFEPVHDARGGDCVFEEFMSYWKFHHAWMNASAPLCSAPKKSCLCQDWIQELPLPCLNAVNGFRFSGQLMELWGMGYAGHSQEGERSAGGWTTAALHQEIFHYPHPKVLHKMRRCLPDVYQLLFQPLVDAPQGVVCEAPSAEHHVQTEEVDDPCGVVLLNLVLPRISLACGVSETLLHDVCSLSCLVDMFVFSSAVYSTRVYPCLLPFLDAHNTTFRFMDQALSILLRCLQHTPAKDLPIPFFFDHLFPCFLQLLNDPSDHPATLVGHYLPKAFSLLSTFFQTTPHQHTQQSLSVSLLRFFQTLLTHDQTQLVLALLRSTRSLSHVFKSQDFAAAVLPFFISFMNSTHRMVRVVFCLCILDVLDGLVRPLEQQGTLEFPTPDAVNDFWCLASPLFPCFESALEDSDELVIEAALEGLLGAFQGPIGLWVYSLGEPHFPRNLLAFQQLHRFKTLAQHLGKKIVPLLYHPSTGISSTAQRLLESLVRTCFPHDPFHPLVVFHPHFIQRTPFHTKPLESISTTLQKWSRVFSRKLFYRLALLCHEAREAPKSSTHPLASLLGDYVEPLRDFLHKSFKRLPVELFSFRDFGRSITKGRCLWSQNVSTQPVLLIPDSLAHLVFTGPSQLSYTPQGVSQNSPRASSDLDLKNSWSPGRSFLMEPLAPPVPCPLHILLAFLLTDGFVHSCHACFTNSAAYSYAFFIWPTSPSLKHHWLSPTRLCPWKPRDWRVHSLRLPVSGPHRGVKQVAWNQHMVFKKHSTMAGLPTTSFLYPGTSPQGLTLNDFFTSTSSPTTSPATLSSLGRSTRRHSPPLKNDASSPPAAIHGNPHGSPLPPPTSYFGTTSLHRCSSPWKPRGIHLATLYPETDHLLHASTQLNPITSLKLDLYDTCHLLLAGVKKCFTPAASSPDHHSYFSTIAVYDCTTLLSQPSKSCVERLKFSPTLQPTAFTLLPHHTCLVLGTQQGTVATYRLDAQKFQFSSTPLSHPATLHASQHPAAVTHVASFDSPLQSIVISAHTNGRIAFWDFRRPHHSLVYSLPYAMGVPTHVLTRPPVLHIATSQGYLVTIDTRYNCQVQVLQALLNEIPMRFLSLRPFTSRGTSCVAVSLASNRNDLCVVDPLSGDLHWAFFSAYTTEPLFYCPSSSGDPQNILTPSSPHTTYDPLDTSRLTPHPSSHTPFMEPFLVPVFRQSPHRLNISSSLNSTFSPTPGLHHTDHHPMAGNILDTFTWESLPSFSSPSTNNFFPQFSPLILTAGSDRCVRYLTTQQSVQHSYIVTSPHPCLTAVYSPLFDCNLTNPPLFPGLHSPSRLIERLHLNSTYLSLAHFSFPTPHPSSLNQHTVQPFDTTNLSLHKKHSLPFFPSAYHSTCRHTLNPHLSSTIHHTNAITSLALAPRLPQKKDVAHLSEQDTPDTLTPITPFSHHHTHHPVILTAARDGTIKLWQ